MSIALRIRHQTIFLGNSFSDKLKLDNIFMLMGRISLDMPNGKTLRIWLMEILWKISFGYFSDFHGKTLFYFVPIDFKINKPYGVCVLALLIRPGAARPM